MASDKASKTEEPTAKRLKEARQEGQIARSIDLVGWAALLAIIWILESTVGKAATFLSKLMNELAALIEKPDVHLAMKFSVDSIRDGFVVIAPLMLGFAVLAIIGHLAQVRFVLSTKAMKPTWQKMNPINGVKRLFSPQSLFLAAKQAVTAAVLGYIGYRTLYSTIIGLSENGPYAVTEVVRVTVVACMSFLKQAAFAGILIGLADYLFMKRKTKKGLMMTKEEVKQETKNQDLSAEVRGKIRQKQRAMSRNRMMAMIPDADVVVVNPVHIAVALKYDAASGAPKVVAKGAGFVAEKIREKADEHRVPLVQDIPLARTLHRICEVDDEIPGAMFEAVAKLLAFVFALKQRGTAAGYHKMPGTPDLAEADAADAREKELQPST